MGCATNTVTARDNFRVLPLTSGTPIAVQYSNVKPVLLFDDGSLTPGEHQTLITDLQQLQKEKYPSHSDALHIQLNSCRVIVHVGKVETQYSALCNAQLSYDEVPLALSSARAERQTRTRGISERQLKQRKNKNPWMELSHTQNVLMAAAEGALMQLLNPPKESGAFYFKPETVEQAVNNNDQNLLRAIMAKQARRDNIEDDALLVTLLQHPNSLLSDEAGRTLFLRCQARNKELLQKFRQQSGQSHDWYSKALACIEAMQRNIMPRREKAQAREHD